MVTPTTQQGGGMSIDSETAEIAVALARLQWQTDQLAAEEEEGWWTHCSGCTDLGESMGSAHRYPVHPIHGCRIGGGCEECNWRGIVLQLGGVEPR